MKKFKISTGDIPTVVYLSKNIPEFINPHNAIEYHQRLDTAKHLILIAYDGGKAIGFKVGYERGDTFYSWMGAILPGYRKQGVAFALAKHQEKWAKQKDFSSITFKTRNHLKGMLIFALKNGFDIIEVEKKEAVKDYRILLRKEL